MLDRRRRGALTAVAAVLAAVVVAVLATLADGRTASQAQTHDGGAWLLNRDVGYVAHVNRVAAEVTGAVRVTEPRRAFDVDQAAGVVLVHDHNEDAATLVDDGRFSAAANILTAGADQLHAVAEGVVAVTADPPAARRFDLEQVARLESVEEIQPVVTGPGPGLVTVDREDRIVLLDADGTLHLDAADGTQERIELGTPTARPAQLTVVGAAVVSLTEDGQFHVADGDGVRTATLGDSHGAGDWVLQQPAPGAAEVVAIDPDGRILAIDLHDTEVRTVGELAGGLPLAPIVHGGCVFSVTLQPPVFTRTCDDEVLETDLSSADRTPTELRLRLVNGWVWVNDVDAGTGWVTDVEDEVTRIDDWDVVLGLHETSEELELHTEGVADEQRVNPDDAELIVNPDQPDLTGPNEPPIARPDTAATREGRAVVVDVLANDEDPNGDVLLVTEVENRSPDDAVVMITGDGSAVQVVPAVGYTGTIRFDYTISDGRGGTASADVTVNVTPRDPDRNRPPEPVIDVATVRAGESVTLNVLTNDRDPDGDLLSLVDVQGEGVAIRHSPDGTVTLTPDPDQEGRLDLTYTVADEWGATAEGRILLEVRLPDSNRPPIARNVAAQTLVDRRVVVDVLANDDDPDGDRLLVQSQPELVFAPAGAEPYIQLDARGILDFEAAEAGTYVLFYTISDGSLTDGALVRVEVADRDVNRPPVAVRDDVVVPVGESRIVPVLRNDHDPDGDVISVVDWSGGEGLVVEELERDRFRVTALPTAPPVSQFRYAISDGVNEPVTAIVVVRVVDAVQPLPPVAVDDEVEVRAGQVSTVHVLDNDHDPAGGRLRVAGVSDPAEASPSSSGDGRTVSLDVPDTTTQGFRFGYEVENERGDRASATVQVRIVPADDPNRAPVAATDIARTLQGQPVVIDVLANDRDPDGDPIELEGVVRQPGSGTAVVLADQRIRYEPDETFTGTDRFTYAIVDARGARATGEVLVGVSSTWPENRPPQAQDDEATAVVGGEPVTIDVLANDRDPDGDPLRVVDVTTPGIGRAAIPEDGLAVVFDPPEQLESGRDEVAFTYTVDDGRGGQDRATVTVTLIDLEPVPDPPEAVDDRVGPVPAGEQLTVDVLANDVLAEEGRDELVVTVGNPEVTVTPDLQLQLMAPERTGTFRYTVTDGHEQSSAATLTVVVQENSPPTVEPLTATTAFETPIEVDLTGQASDADGDELFFLCCDNVRGGSVTVLSEDARSLRVRFTPDDGFDGQAGFAYTVDDQQGHQVAGSATIVVEPREHEPPVAGDTDTEVEAGGTGSVDLRALVTGPRDNAQLTFELAERSGPVEASLRGSSLQLRAEVDAVGNAATVGYQVTDVAGQLDTGTVRIGVTPTSAPLPEARADTARTIQGEPVDVRVLDNDVGEELRVVDANGSLATGAEVVADGQQVRLSPQSDFFGTTSASYVVRDRYDDPSREVTGRIELTVIGRPDGPGAPRVESDSRQATLVWTTPASNGAPIEAYEVQHDQGGERTIDPTSTLTWTGLTNGTTYRFRVRAINEAGSGEFSPWSSPVTPDEVPGRPGPPQVRFGDEELHVSWQQPANEGTPITTYVLEIGGAVTDLRELPAGAGVEQSYTWRGLRNGANHTFRVKAVNAADEAGGDYSGWSEPEHPLTQPDAPRTPTLEGGPNYLEVTWSRPGDGGDPIQGYEVQIDDDAGATVRVSGATSTTYRWGDLTNGVQHRFRVRAWNRDERGGQWSSFSELGRACDVPDAPAAPEVTRGDRSVDLRWSAPGTNGCEILGYDVRIQGDGATRSAAAGATSTTIDGLNNGETYRFELRARNEQGDGDWSELSAPVVPAGPPFATTIDAIDAPSTGVLVVRWSAPGSNGADITGYEVELNGSVGQTVTTTEARFSGLDVDRRYDFRVRAINDVGPADWSPVSSRRAEGPPNQVTGLSVDNSTRGQLRWTWSQPDNNGATIQGYRVERRGSSSGSCRLDGRSYTCTGMSDNVSSEIRVRAYNTHGDGQWSGWVGGTTQPPPPPPPPSSWQVTNNNSFGTCPEDDPRTPPFNYDGEAKTCSSGFIGTGTTVTVTCQLTGVAEFGGSGTATWYRIQGGDWSSLYVYADHMSGSTSGMPDC